METIIRYAFGIGQTVRVKELELNGLVIGLWTGRMGNEIQVRVFTNGKHDNIYFMENELEDIK